MVGMPPTPDPALPDGRAARLEVVQAAIREVLSRGPLTDAERLELARWQREWVRARRGGYVTAA